MVDKNWAKWQSNRIENDFENAVLQYLKQGGNPFINRDCANRVILLNEVTTKGWTTDQYWILKSIRLSQ